MKLKNLKISKQLNISMGVILLFVMLIGAFSLFNTSRLLQNNMGLYEHPLIEQIAIGDLKADILNIRIVMKELVVNNIQKTQEQLIAIDAYQGDANKQLDILYNSYRGPKSDIDNAYNSTVNYKSIRDETIRLFRAGNISEAVQQIAIDGVGGVQVQSLMKDLAKINNFAKNSASQFYSNAQQQNNQNIFQLAITFVTILFLLVGIVLLLRNGILVPLKELTYATEAFRQGKMDTRSRYESTNEFGRLSLSFNAMTETIKREIQNKENLATGLIAANRELEAFSYSISHDLKAPLRHITGYISLLVKKYIDLLPEEGRHYLDNISFSARNMGELIDGLLQFSRTGRIDMNQRLLNMNEIIDDLIWPIKEQDAKQRIIFNINPMPPAFGDFDMIKSVWSNLIENAVKFTKNKDLAKITIGAEENEKDTIYYIKDNGAGFDMNYATKLFAVFQRLHSREDYDGTGIGLATVQRIITRHGGKTWAEGKVGEGATFYFSLIKRKESE